MLTTVLISIAFGALVALFVVFIREEYRSYQMKKFFKSLSVQLRPSNEEEQKIESLRSND